MKKRLLFLLISLLPLLGIGATTLAPGDIVIVAINGDADATTGHIYGKGFSFMTLVNLAFYGIIPLGYMVHNSNVVVMELPL